MELEPSISKSNAPNGQADAHKPQITQVSSSIASLFPSIWPLAIPKTSPNAKELVGQESAHIPHAKHTLLS